jgi:glycine/D-amino acid oxidase-like deaminating enzyme
MSTGLRVVVVGGGVAGLSTAWWLARRGHRVTLVEREAAPGVHASGRNAGLVRHVVSDPHLLELGRRGAAWLLAPPPDLADGPLARRTGSWLLAGARERAGLEAAARAARAAGVECAFAAPPADLPVEPAPGMVALWTPGDGLARPDVVVDALAGACARAGVDLRLGRAAALVTTAGAVRAVQVGDEALGCDVAVDAAGPWARELAAAAGGAPPPLVSLRRHLFALGAAGPTAASWVWDLERGVYARSWDRAGAGGDEAGRALLVCACDEDPRPPEDADEAPGARERLADVLRQAAPRLLEREVRAAWAGLRTFAPDRRFVIGWDPAVAGLFLVAGLGGHGLTSGVAVGELAARAIEGAAGDDAALLRALSPGRLAAAAAAGAAR